MAEPVADRRSPFRSGAFRFALIFAAVFAVAAFLLLAMVHHQIDRYAREATVGTLTTESAILATGDGPEALAAIRHRLRAAPDSTFIYTLFDPAGRRLLGRIPARAAHVGWDEVVMVERPSTPQDPEMLERLVTLGTRLSDGSLLLVATDGYDIERVDRHMIDLTTLWAVGITLLALLSGWMAGWFFLKRLAAANAAIDRIMTGRIEQRLPMIGLAPELDDLARNLNRMLDRIDGLMEGLRQVSTDIAHDLRTPLTRLRQRLEAAREAGTGEETEAGIEAALAQADQLLAIFRAILRLAQIEGGGRRVPFAPVDLGALITTLIETYDPVAADADHGLAAGAIDGAVVDGDGELLAQLFSNLIENAILHTPAGTKVAVDIAQDPATIRVAVRDDGPGVPPAERERIVRRFYQVDPSRGGGGSGLGLSIVSAIVTLHGAELSIDDARPGLCVTVAFPRGGTA